MRLLSFARKVDKKLLIALVLLTILSNLCLFLSQLVALEKGNSHNNDEQEAEAMLLLSLPTWKRRRHQQSHKHDDTKDLNSFFPPLKGPGFADLGGEVPVDSNNRIYPNPLAWNSLDNDTCLHQQPHPIYSWQRQAPYAIVLGAMKAGTQALMYYLSQHPNVTRGTHERTPETHFFNSPEWFSSTPQGISQIINQKAYANKMQSLFPDMFVSDDIAKETSWNTRKRRRTTTIRAKPHLIALDSTPYYLLASDRIPNYINCVAPWAKLIALVRNPVERAASHSRYLAQARQDKQKPMVSWERWVHHDLQLLQRAGVIQDWNETDSNKSGSAQELEAWKRYVRSHNSQHLLGRGLYAIQLEHYLEALQRAGRPRSDLHVILSEELRNSTQQVYDKLLEFLQLPPHTLRNVRLQDETTSDAGIPMPKHIRTQLEQFFEPYNQRLFRLLKWSSSTWHTPSGNVS